jgi:hypothetical protein
MCSCGFLFLDTKIDRASISIDKSQEFFEHRRFDFDFMPGLWVAATANIFSKLPECFHSQIMQAAIFQCQIGIFLGVTWIVSCIGTQDVAAEEILRVTA